MSSDVSATLGGNRYLLLTPFYMPSDRGAIWAVAFSSDSILFVSAGISVAFTAAFVYLWNIVRIMVLISSKGKGRRRYVALVTLWNSSEPGFAFQQMIAYSLRCCFAKISETPGTSKTQVDRVTERKELNRDRWYGIIATAFAFAVYGAGLTLGIIGPWLLEIGNVAPPQPSILFYPAEATDNREYFRRPGLQASGALRALGSVEAAEATVAKRTVLAITNQGGQMLRISYGYLLTGVDFGLQRAPHLELAVRGSCVTEYGWLATPAGNNSQAETYSLWRGNVNVTIPFGDADIRYAPRASFITRVAVPPDDGNVSFAIVVASAHRTSISSGSDPWYETELRPESAPPTNMNASFWIRRGRSVLSCWQQDNWTHGGQTVHRPGELYKLPGLNVPNLLLSVFKSAFNVPMLVALGTAGEDSALKSRIMSRNGVIDAEASSIIRDMQRLIVGSFVASRSVLVDTTMYGRRDLYDPANILLGPNGQPLDGAADFVISDPTIKTFSLGGIVAVSVASAFLLLLSLATAVARQFPGPQHDIKKPAPLQESPNVWARLRVLSADQLFRCVYEPGNNPLSDWRCTGLPGSEEVSLAACDKGKYCKGHITNRKAGSVTNPEAGSVTNPEAGSGGPEGGRGGQAIEEGGAVRLADLGPQSQEERGPCPEARHMV
ncbi:hypothetical protein MAPG_03835 [Magnaporthiopsis poae ATCC 64411]|uniref:Uncharacterized protein n=1 Tax=Magnaporthiopsis poae (strain ATCC 64411 / 73-15) TaxID=644358 RepID=A0A0C4DV35_MAGP6|nr:hypothetical protein MAPG_03835 [Magnaporthiopsis poae ATCC 64411]